ncbi:hypothetical protein EJB05_54660, partial [Eragrostis curvula]
MGEAAPLEMIELQPAGQVVLEDFYGPLPHASSHRHTHLLLNHCSPAPPVLPTTWLLEKASSSSSLRPLVSPDLAAAVARHSLPFSRPLQGLPPSPAEKKGASFQRNRFRLFIGILEFAGERMGSESKKTASRHTTEAETGTHAFEIVGYTLKKGVGFGQFIRSGTFTVGGSDWSIRLYPDGLEGTTEYVTIFLVFMSKKANVRASYQLSLPVYPR